MQNKNTNTNTNTERKRVTVWDFVIMAVLLCAAVMVIFLRSGGSDEELTVVVKKDSEIVYSQRLSDSSSELEVLVDDEYNIILSVMPDGVQVLSLIHI